MRIAVELPGELLRRIKVHAAMTDQKLKALMPTLLDAGLAVMERSTPARPSGRPPRATAPRPRRVVSGRTASRRH